MQCKPQHQRLPFFFVHASSVSSYLASERKLQRDSSHVAIRAEGAERGQSADGQRGPGGEDRSRAQSRGGQAEILASGEGKSPYCSLYFRIAIFFRSVVTPPSNVK